MAFVDPSQVVPAQPGQQQGQAPIAAGGAGIGGATKQAASAPGVNVPAQPSAQLSSYLAANQPQTTAFAGNIANTVGQQTQAAGAAIQPAVNVYSGQQYTVPTDAAVNSQVATAPSALTPDQTQTFQTELAAGANAPNSANTFESTPAYQGIASNIQNAVEQANLWNSGNNVANLSTALTPFEGGNQTSGDTTLDALLLSGTPGAYKQITDAVAPAANLPGQLTAGTTAADQALQTAIAQDQATTAAATAAPQTYASNLNTYLQTGVNNATTGGAATNARILQDLTANTPTQADLTALGISAADWATLSNEMAGAASAGVPISLAAYLSQTTPGGVTPANLASSTQYSDVAALQNILGGNAPVEPISNVTANQAGTAPTSFNKFNLSDAEKAASNNATVKALEQAAQATADQAAYANQQYNIDHFGGTSPGDFNAYIGSLNAQIANLNAQIKAILGNSPGYVPGTQVPVPGGGQSVSDTAKSYVPVISDVSSVANDIGSFFGF